MNAKRADQKGQALVMISIALLAFMAILALVLDGGYAYYMRRVAQNAADAGAMAGASALCRSEDAETAARTYVEANNATLFSITYPNDTVEVTSEIIFDTFIGSVLGVSSITTRAVAAAGCFPPGGSNVVPIAWSCRPPVGGAWDPDKCELKYMEGEVCSFPDDPVYIVADEVPIASEVTCQYPPNSGDPPGAIDCDFDNNGDDDIAGIQNGTKTWMDLDGGGAGTSELVGLVNGTLKIKIAPHYWVPPAEGDKTPVYQEVDKFLNKDFIIPVYDRICNGLPPGACPGVQWDAEDVVIDNSGKDHFHIASLALFRPICTDPPSPGSPKPDCKARKKLEEILLAAGATNGDINKMKTIEGCFVEGFIPSVGGDPDMPFAGTWTIYLIK